MWSPALCPKPDDWGEHIDVVGNFFTGDIARIADARLRCGLLVTWR